LVGFVDGSGTPRPHFVKRDANAACGYLPGSLGTGQPAADDRYHGPSFNTKRQKRETMKTRRKINAKCAKDAE
jgi:hypothetical protein